MDLQGQAGGVGGTAALNDEARRLADLVAPMLAAPRIPSDLEGWVATLTAFLASHSGFSPDAAKLNEATLRRADGLTVSPHVAAMCAQGGPRTLEYLRALKLAIARINRQNPDRSARILYVGCGPYATLATPLLPLLDPTQAQFTLLDFHGAAIASVQRLHRALGVQDRVVRAEAGDALTYRIDPESPPDIILMEIMLAALKDEPQVAITRHLSAQAPEALLIPEAIRIDLAWSDPAVEFSARPLQEKQSQRLTAGRVFTLDREAVRRWNGLQGDRLPGIEVRVPEGIERGHQPLWLTRLDLFGPHHLDDYEDGLTCPQIADVAGPLCSGDRIEVRYRLGERPGLVGEVVETV